MVKYPIINCPKEPIWIAQNNLREGLPIMLSEFQFRPHGASRLVRHSISAKPTTSRPDCMGAGSRSYGRESLTICPGPEDRIGSSAAVTSALASGLLYLSHPTLAGRISTSRSCQKATWHLGAVLRLIASSSAFTSRFRRWRGCAASRIPYDGLHATRIRTAAPDCLRGFSCAPQHPASRWAGD